MVQSTHRRAALALAAGTSALAILATVVLVADSSEPAYIMPAWVIVVAAVCVALTVVGSAAAVRRGHVTPWMAPAAITVLAVACLEGIVLLVPIALIVLVLTSSGAMRRVSRRIPWDRRVGTAGVLLTLGLVPLFLLIFLGRPVVACSAGGGSNAIPIWAWYGDSSGFSVSTTGSAPGSAGSTVGTGTATVGATTYSWVCDGSTVTHFTTHR